MKDKERYSIAHACVGVNPDIDWDALSKDLPQLKRDCAAILGE